MRVVISDQHERVIIALPLPDSDTLADMSRRDEESASVFFGSGDTTDEKPWKVSVAKLIKAGKRLAKAIEHREQPIVKQITVHLDDGSIRGPAKGMTGFTLNGIPASVRRTITGRFVLKLLRDGRFEKLDLTGVSSYRLDQGVVCIKYATPYASFSEAIHQIESIMQDVKQKSVLVHVEY